MSERIEPKNCYAQQLPQYVYYENIPMGKPLPRDNDSSFASEYPTIWWIIQTLFVNLNYFNL